MAEVRYAIRVEMAVHLSDVLFRRTGLGTLGNPATENIEEIAGIMAKELKWSKTCRNAEMERALGTFESRKE